jgi:hypothetical protein
MKRLLLFALIAALFLPAVAQDETRVQLANLLRPRLSSYAFNLNQNLRTTDSPTFAGLTLSGGTASTLAYLNASKAFTSLANGSGYLLNDGSGGLSWGAISFTGYLKADGTVPLTADWNVGAFDLTCVDMNATNFKLSGTGTLTSVLGNATFTTALTAASGNEAALTLNYTTNKAAGNDTGLVVNMTDTASPGTSNLLDLQVATVSKASIDNAGTILTGSYINLTSTSGSLRLRNSGTLLYSDANNQFDMRYSTNPQSFNVYGTYTSATSYERGFLRSTASAVEVGTGKGSAGGTARPLNFYTNEVLRAQIDTSGNIAHLGANSQATNFKQATAVITTTAAATATATNLIPAGSMVVGVTCRNTTAVTGDGSFSGYSIGDGVDDDRWGANVNPGLDETTDLTDAVVLTPAIFTAATSVVLTQVGGTAFAADKTIRVTVHYISLTAPVT